MITGRWTKWLAVFAAVVTAAVSVPVQAGTGSPDHIVYDYSDTAGWPKAPEVSAKSVYMIELNSGAVLYEKDPDLQSFPASTTKIMTALLTLENCGLDEEVSFSHDAVTDIEEGGNHWEFQEGEILNVNECMQFLLVESVNEVAYALAEHIAGGLSAFADMMNQRAKELGAVNTHFANPHGLNDSNHYTTARDMAMVLWGCVQNDRFQMYASLPTVKLKGRAVQTGGFSKYTNHHKMLLPDSEWYYEDVVAGKTGYTSLAGNTLVTYARRGAMDVVCVLMKGGSDRFNDTKLLLNYAFDNFQLVNTSDLAGEAPPAAGAPPVLDEETAAGGYLLLPKDADLAQVTSDFAVDEDAGSSEGISGTRTWSYLGETIQTEQVEAAGDLSVHVEPEMVNTSGGEDGKKSSSGSEGDPGEGAGNQNSSQKMIGGWQMRELITLAVLGVLVLFLLILMIHLLRARARARRRRRRRMQQRRMENRRMDGYRDGYRPDNRRRR